MDTATGRAPAGVAPERGANAGAAAVPTGGPGAIRFAAVNQSYGDTRVIEDLSFEILAGEFFSILGPSGSGKTTCLRLIAGFERPTAGRVFLGGIDVSDEPPNARDVNTVFQDYALFPHLTVLQNVEYGLRVKGVPAAECTSRARDALAMVELGDMQKRAPAQLSGGQRQRVALARALVNRPSVLLLDEPLGALDLRLREQMQMELKRLHRQLGITFVYVTHDQGEAMSMSDRIAVLQSGRIHQLAPPRELYQRPATAFVAEFVGSSNVLRGSLARAAGATAPLVSLRPENITLLEPTEPAPPGHVTIGGVLRDVQFHGASTRYRVDVDGTTLTIAAQNAGGEPLGARAPGASVRLAWAAAAMVPLES